MSNLLLTPAKLSAQNLIRVALLMQDSDPLKAAALASARATLELVDELSQDLTANNKEGVACIDRGYHWRDIDASTSIGMKMQLINKSAGVAMYGNLMRRNNFFTHWAPLPTFAKN